GTGDSAIELVDRAECGARSGGRGAVGGVLADGSRVFEGVARTGGPRLDFGHFNQAAAVSTRVFRSGERERGFKRAWFSSISLRRTVMRSRQDGRLAFLRQ